MRTLKQILENPKDDKWLNNWGLHQIEPDRVVTHTMLYGRAVPLENPTFASEVRCTHCGDDKGFWIPDGNCWSCMNPECICKNAHPEPGLVEFLEEEHHRKSAISQCKQEKERLDFCEQWVRNPKTFVTFGGTNGTGKTHLSKAVCQDFRGDSKFITMTDLHLEWVETQHKYGITASMVREYAAVPLLVIDDLGTRTPTDAFMDFIYAVVDKRYNENRGTIITTNLTSKDIRTRFGDAIASRIMTGKNFWFEGNDRRIEHNKPKGG